MEGCDNFQIDLAGEFGICRNCKFPKIKHPKPTSPPVNKLKSSNIQEKKIFNPSSNISDKKPSKFYLFVTY